MTTDVTLIERAFAIAKSGACESMQVLREQIKAEGYVDVGQLYGPSIRSQLSKLMAAAKRDHFGSAKQPVTDKDAPRPERIAARGVS